MSGTFPTIGSISSRPVHTVSSLEPLINAARMMSEKSISCVVVLEDDKPVGIITERDIVRLISRDVSPVHNHAREVMSKPLISVEANEHPTKGLEIMISKGIRCLPVLKNGRLVGIVTQRDLLRWLAGNPDVLQAFVSEKFPVPVHGEALASLLSGLDDIRKVD